MAKPRRAERERNSNSNPTEPVEPAGSNSEPEGNQQQQSNLPDENRNVVVIEPSSAQQSEPTSPASGGSGRGRPRSGATPRRSAARISPEKSKEGLTILLTGVHALGAKLVHECLALDKAEAAQLSEAIFTVNELYDNGLISPKAAAWGNLLTCAGMIYGPRAAVMLFKKKISNAAERGN